MDPLVVYIIADNRSGSTLLDYLLSCHPDAVSVGELHHLHNFYYKKGVGRRTNWKCSCDNFVQDCIFWKKILKRVSFNKTFETKLVSQKPKWDVLRLYISKVGLIKLFTEKDTQKKGKLVAKNRWKIYEAVMEQTGKSVIIDSSKDALEGFFLNKYKQGSIKFLFLERNIYEVAYSKMNRRREIPENIKPYYHVKDKSIYWYIINTYKQLFKNRSYMNEIGKASKGRDIKTINYNDLTNRPKDIIADICKFLDIKYFEPPITTNANMNEIHILGGSPSRYVTKEIRPDMRWKHYFKNKPIAFSLGRILQNF